ncbi:MAG TPA: hypothetical protein VFP65_25285 [Anaeromyxobacteraceae bacterium]|nr:hypothetical protein [Anaeromyxobacteraceae bacterium]
MNRRLLLVVVAATAAGLSARTPASEPVESDVQLQLQGRTHAGYTILGPRPLDTILSFLRQESLASPVPGVQARLQDVLERLDGGRAAARMVDVESTDWRHPFARVVVDPDGRPVIEYALPTWNARARAYRVGEPVDHLKDLTVAATLHAWEHFVLHHHVGGDSSEEAVTRQESEVWQDMVLNVLAPGRMARHFAFSEREDRETYFGLLCFAAADSQLDHPAWQAFLEWVASPRMGGGVPVCRDVERDRSARL